MNTELFDNLKDVFELATGATAFINEISKLKKNNKKQDEDDAIISSSGNSAQIGSSGDSAQIGSSGNSAQIGSSGNCAQIGSSGDYAQIGSSGNCAQIGSSGDYARIDSTGGKAVVAAIGYKSIAKAKVGSWLTLAEYDLNGEPLFVKTEQVDNIAIKEDTYYTLYNRNFQEVQIIDEVPTIILKRKNNIIKCKFLNNYEDCWVFEKNGIYAHGGTVKQAYFDWLFKTSDRDVEQYRSVQTDEIHELSYWVVAYRTITGACSLGTNNYLENNKDKYKDKMTLNEVIKATEGQYGSNTFKEFFQQM